MQKIYFNQFKRLLKRSIKLLESNPEKSENLFKKVNEKKEKIRNLDEKLEDWHKRDYLILNMNFGEVNIGRSIDNELKERSYL